MERQNEYERFQKIIENWVDMMTIEGCMTTDFYGYELDLDEDDGNSDQMEELIDTIINKLCGLSDLKKYTKLVTQNIIPHIERMCIEMMDERDYLQEDIDLINKYKLLKLYVKLHLMSNTHIVFNSITNIYKQLH